MSIEAELEQMADPEIESLQFIMYHEKTRQIVNALLMSDRLYFNQLYEKVGGNRSSVADTLHNLEKRNIITSDWELQTIPDKDMKRAVKNYHINEESKLLINSFRKLISG